MLFNHFEGLRSKGGKPDAAENIENLPFTYRRKPVTNPSADKKTFQS